MKQVSGPFELPSMGGELLSPGHHVPFKIMDTYIKHFPVEYHAQTAVEAALALRSDLIHAEGPNALSQVQDVEIGSYDIAIEIIGRDPEKWCPSTRETADHSFPYCVAVALLKGRMTLNAFSPRLLQDPELRGFMKKIRVVARPELKDRYPQEMPTVLTVRTATGKEYRQEIALPLGHPGNPMSDRHLEEKFRAMAGNRLSHARMNQIIALVWQLERVKDTGSLMSLMKVKNRDVKIA